MSVPTQNAFSPVPVRITARKLGSEAKLRNRSVSDKIISPVSEFNLSGRLSRTIATPSCRLKSIKDIESRVGIDRQDGGAETPENINRLRWFIFKGQNLYAFAGLSFLGALAVDIPRNSKL